jgi:hypothetical protein
MLPGDLLGDQVDRVGPHGGLLQHARIDKQFPQPLFPHPAVLPPYPTKEFLQIYFRWGGQIVPKPLPPSGIERAKEKKYAQREPANTVPPV